jgi:MarR family transcriptional regulator, organic hydroperoxide resistance regulator
VRRLRPTEQIRFLILAAQREGNRQLAQTLRPLGITPSQGEVLRLLADRQPLTLSGLGELLVCESGTNPSRLVDRLVAAGLVKRVEAWQDRRTVTLTLTSDGAQVAEQVAKVEERLYREFEVAGAGRDLDEVIGYLRALTVDQPSGRAVRLRTADPAGVGAATSGTAVS